MATFPTEPALHKHHGGRSWTSYWRDDDGKMRVKRLGKESEIDKREARARYQMWLDTEWKVKDSIKNPLGAAAGYTCTRLAAQYLRHAHRTFRKRGRPTTHVVQVRYAMRALRDFRGRQLAETMESPHLADIRDRMIHGQKTVRRRDAETGKVGRLTQKYVRSITTVNGRLLIIKEAFEWAREKGRVPRIVVLDLQTVKPLARGRSQAKDPELVAPIAMAVVEATLPACSRVVAAMIVLNVFTGARPGEICIMRPCDLEVCTPDCWVYAPDSNKMEHKGVVRKIAMGPRAIEAVRPFLECQMNTRGYLFSPAAARAEFNENRRRHFEAQRLKDGKHRSPGQLSRLEEKRPEDPRRAAGDCYSEESYRKAIHHACRKTGIAPWNPNQLRHTHATEVRRVFGAVGIKDQGLAAARDTLGHSDSRTTEGYALESIERAMEIARRVG